MNVACEIVIYNYLMLSEYKSGLGRYVMAKCDKSMSGSLSEEHINLTCFEIFILFCH